MVEQNISKIGFAFWRVEGRQVNACIDERLIGWCEECEWPGALQCFEQFSLDHSGDKRVVNACALCCAWDILGSLRGREHLIDDVNDTVACCDIGCCDRCAVHHHGCSDSEGKWVSVDRFCDHTIGDR